MDKIVERRLNTAPIGFGSTKKNMSDDEKNINMLNKVRQEDLKKFGLIPELIGRFPIIVHTNRRFDIKMIEISH